MYCDIAPPTFVLVAAPYAALMTTSQHAGRFGHQAVTQAKARPVSPVYPEISESIDKNVNAALSGQVSPADAMKKADEQINEALATF
jgi:ABC-type glycerol-3-phosphate transport system substrate-binding protein